MSRPLSLLEAFALVPDPRSRRGRVHPLVATLGLATVATLAGCLSLEAIAQFGRDHGTGLAHALGYRRRATPTKSALSKLFRRLDVAAVEAALRSWLDGRGATAAGHLALDGKTLIGSKADGLRGRHLLAAYATEHAAVVGQVEVARTTNEHKAALRLLGVLPLAGVVVTADAMFTHPDVCDTITDAGGDYVLRVKDNQETLHRDIEDVFAADAAFSPLPTAGRGGRAADGVGGRQGARAAGAAVDHHHHRPEPLPDDRRVAGRGAGDPGRAGATGEGGGDGRGGLLHHQPEPAGGRRRAATRPDPVALGDREPAALRPGCDAR